MSRENSEVAAEYIDQLISLAKRFNERRRLTTKSLAAADLGWFIDPEMGHAYSGIREIGWELYARGGLELLGFVSDEIYERDGRAGSCIEHRWSGIGNDNAIWIP